MSVFWGCVLTVVCLLLGRAPGYYGADLRTPHPRVPAAMPAQLEQKATESTGVDSTPRRPEAPATTPDSHRSTPARSSNTTVYKTVDANGVVTYSDVPPAEEVEVETLVIDVQAPELSESAHEQLESLRDTTDRMVADRQQREKHRAELRKLQAQAAPQQPLVIDDTDPAGYDDIYSGYYPYPVYRPRGGHRPRPVHPIARPPLRPVPPVPEPRSITPGYDYPASLIRRGYSPEVRAAFE